MKIIIFAICTLFSVSSLAGVSAKDFARLPMFSLPSLSPSGDSFAYMATANDKPVLVTRPLTKKGSKYKVSVIPLDGLHVNRIRWINDERLLIVVRMTVKRPRVGLVNISRIFSINRDGSNPVFFKMKPNELGYYLQYPSMIHSLPDDPKHVLLSLDHSKHRWATSPVHKVNIYTGERVKVESNARGFAFFHADYSGNVRIAVKALDGGKMWAMYYRKTVSAPWTLLQKETYNSDSRMSALRFDYEDDNILLISSKGLEDENIDDGKDVYRYNLTTQKVIGPYTHPARDAAERVIRKSFEGRAVDLISWVDNITLDKAIYEVSSDTLPAQYYIYDIKARVVNYLGSSYPQLEVDGLTLSPMKEVVYKSRDGLTVPAYLTLPKASTGSPKVKPPLVVYPHGGPWARDYWGFDNYVQFFASQGYAVFQPQFRGSTGFGYAHLEAGYKQWGLAIQDDITDGVQWLIKEGKVDPNRICIVGSSFGGYAAAMGLTKTPELYKCGVSINGVLDMKRYHDSLGHLIYAKLNREITNSDWGIKKVSPYHLRDKIKVPLLLIAGEKDTVVPNKHSKTLYKKLKRKGSVQYVELPKGEHWRTIESNEIKKLEVIGEFLSQHLK